MLPSLPLCSRYPSLALAEAEMKCDGKEIKFRGCEVIERQQWQEHVVAVDCVDVLTYKSFTLLFAHSSFTHLFTRTANLICSKCQTCCYQELTTRKRQF